MIRSASVRPAALLAALAAAASLANVFDEGMWAPSSPLPVASAAQATRHSSTAGAASGQGVGAAQEAVRRD
jgi:hypothetical protein